MAVAGYIAIPLLASNIMLQPFALLIDSFTTKLNLVTRRIEAAETAYLRAMRLHRFFLTET